MRITELELEDGESVFVVLKDDEGRRIHAVTVFAHDGKIQTSS